MKETLIIQNVIDYAEGLGIVKGQPTYSRRMEQKYIRFYLFRYLRQKGYTLEMIASFFNMNHASVVWGLKTWEDSKHFEDVKAYTHDTRFIFPLELDDVMESRVLKIGDAMLSMENSLVTK